MGSPFSQLQNLYPNLSGREIGIEKFKPYTFGTDRPALDIGLYGSAIFAVTEQTSDFDVGITSGNLDKGLLEKSDSSYGHSGVVVGQPNGIFDNIAAPSGKKFGHPLDVGDFSTVQSGSVDRPLSEYSSMSSIPSGDLEEFTKETGQQFYSRIPTFGGLHGYDKDISDLDFLFITGAYQSGDGPFIPPVLFPTTGDEFGNLDFLFITGTYQG
jgi:hypothetical protein